jgi:hypothetical protein
MEDPWIGKVMFVGIVMFVVWLIQTLFTAKTEVARRIKIVLACLVALAFVAGVFAAVGPVGLAVTLVAIGVVIWIVRGA